jgi:flagellar hook-basal body complex protein FliE
MTQVNTQGIDQLLQELNRLSARAAGQSEPAAAPESSAAGAAPEFGAALKAALEQANDAQEEAIRLQREFDLNAPNVNLHEVMVSLQKASLSFQTMVQVRNRLVSAYQEIMNMQV